jgi:hypothetical protein
VKQLIIFPFYFSIQQERWLRVFENRVLRLGRHVARKGAGSAYRFFVRKPEGRRQRVDGREIREKRGMDWIDLAQGRDRRRTLVNAVMNLRVP